MSYLISYTMHLRFIALSALTVPLYRHILPPVLTALASSTAGVSLLLLNLGPVIFRTCLAHRSPITGTLLRFSTGTFPESTVKRQEGLLQILMFQLQPSRIEGLQGHVGSGFPPPCYYDLHFLICWACALSSVLYEQHQLPWIQSQITSTSRISHVYISYNWTQ